MSENTVFCKYQCIVLKSRNDNVLILYCDICDISGTYIVYCRVALNKVKVNLMALRCYVRHAKHFFSDLRAS